MRASDPRVPELLPRHLDDHIEEVLLNGLAAPLANESAKESPVVNQVTSEDTKMGSYKNKAKWTAGLALVVALLGGAYRIIEMDRAAMSGATTRVFAVLVK